MSDRRIFSKSVFGVKTKYKNDYCVIYKDYEWNEYIVKDYSDPDYDIEGIEYGYFTDCQIDAIDTFHCMTENAIKRKEKKEKESRIPLSMAEWNSNVLKAYKPKGDI